MPTFTNTVLSQLRHSHPIIPTRVPYSPSNPWLHGTIFIFPPENKMLFHGLLSFSSTDSEGFQGSGYESGIPYGYAENEGATEDSQTSMDLTASSNDFFAGRLDPKILIKFKFTGNVNYQYWIGFSEQINLTNATNGDPIGHASLDPTYYNGIGLYCSNGNNFKVLCNDGTSTSHLTADLDTFDQDIHTFYLESDHANSRWGYSLDNAAIQYVTTSIPSANVGMKLNALVQNMANASVAKRFTLYDLEAWERRIPVS